MSARQFFRRTSMRIQVFWNYLKCRPTRRANATVEEIRESPELAEENDENANDIVSFPVYQSASFSSTRFAQMPLLPGEVPTNANRCQSVMMGSISNVERPVVQLNRFVNTQRRVRPRGARYGFSRQNMERSVHHEVESEGNSTPGGENVQMMGDNAGADEEMHAAVGHVVGGGEMMVLEDVQ